MDEAQDGHRRVGPALALAALWLIGAVVYAVLGHHNDIPSISPDEFSYGHLARSIADGEGLAWRGIGEPFRAALYMYVIAPAWLVSSTTKARWLRAPISFWVKTRRASSLDRPRQLMSSRPRKS